MCVMDVYVGNVKVVRLRFVWGSFFLLCVVVVLMCVICVCVCVSCV